VHLDFWFDFISPYAYFAWLRIRDVASETGATLRLRPVALAALLDHHGQLGPAEIPAKREHTLKDVARYAAAHGLELRGPATHPFNPLTALRCSLPEVAGDQQAEVIDALFRAGWSDGADLGDPEAIARALSAAGLDGPALVARTREAAVKQALIEEGRAAIARGVFGVPMMDADGELIWGNDRMAWVTLRLQGRDPLPSGVQALLDRPAGARRPGARRP
jgi:2-hydroxychromene-2-carboxylate isomerase